MTNKALPHTFQTRVVAATSVKKDVLVDRCCRPNSSIRAAKLVVCRKTRLPQAERPAVMNYTNGLSHQSTPGNLSTNAFLYCPVNTDNKLLVLVLPKSKDTQFRVANCKK